MVTNPLGAMPGSDDDDQGSNADSPEIAECEQKIEDLTQRVSALEQKVGMGSAPKSPGVLPTKATSGPMPFIGSMK